MYRFYDAGFMQTGNINPYKLVNIPQFAFKMASFLILIIEMSFTGSILCPSEDL